MLQSISYMHPQPRDTLTRPSDGLHHGDVEEGKEEHRYQEKQEGQFMHRVPLHNFLMKNIVEESSFLPLG